MLALLGVTIAFVAVAAGEPILANGIAALAGMGLVRARRQRPRG